MNDKEKEIFNYTYSAKQQEEIKAIRKKYAVSEEKEDMMTLIRRLDDGVAQKATVFSLVVGIIGALILGFGMSLVMTELPEMLGWNSVFGMAIGVVIGVAGIIFVCCAYPVYNRTVKKEREKIAPEIIRLTDELMK